MRDIISWVALGLAIAAAALASVQPVLGSFAFFRPGDSFDYETIHLVIGGILYNVVLLLAVLVPFSWLRWRWVLFLISIAQYGLIHLQLLLGLRSNDDPGLLAFHIPIGVLIFFLTYLTAALVFYPRFTSNEE